jgi:surface antigen
MKQINIKYLSRKTAIILVALLFMSASMVAVLIRPVSADQYDDKIRALQADMRRYQAEADRLNNEASTLANAISQITNEKNAIQAQLDVSQAQHDKLVLQIADTETAIKENQDALGAILADLYIDDNISPIEMLASSENIGDFLNKQEYRSSIKDELGATIQKVKSLRKELTAKREEVKVVLETQKAARDQLAVKEAEQSRLLAQTQNDESKYQGMIKDSAAQIAEAKATQAAIRSRLNSTGGYSLVAAGSLSDYPWNSSNCPMWGYLSTGGADGNGGDGRGYGCRQCASYVAWRIAKETGVYYRWGNAVNFTGNAKAAGYQDLGMNPQPGSIAVMNPAKAGQGFGHVAWVESVSGNNVTVSQYNYDYGQGYGLYSKMTMSKYAFDNFVKII